MARRILKRCLSTNTDRKRPAGDKHVSSTIWQVDGETGRAELFQEVTRGRLDAGVWLNNNNTIHEPIKTYSQLIMSGAIELFSIGINTFRAFISLM